jgi:hypothetical protein
LSMVREASAQIAVTPINGSPSLALKYFSFACLLLLVLLAGSWLGLSGFSGVDVDKAVAVDESPPAALAEPQHVPPVARVGNAAQTAVVPVSESKAAVHRLQELWGLPVGGNIRILCGSLPGQLDCLRVSAATFIDIVQYNRPVVVTLVSERGEAEQLVVVSVAGSDVTVAGLSGEKVLNAAEFIAGWDGSLWLLWHKPEAFSGWIRPGDRSPAMVAWLNERLLLLNDNSEELVTGGRYSLALAEKIVQLQREHKLSPDGVLGEKTIMLINSLLAAPPTLNGGGG